MKAKPEELNEAGKNEQKRSISSIALEIVIIFVISYIIAYILGHFILGNFQIQQRSMEPTIYENERVVINRAVYYFGNPARGDIVILLDPITKQRDFIKRIIALPGETLEIRYGKIYVNGTTIKEPYRKNDGSSENIGPIRIPKEEYYVMGDNRSNSTDSRYFGSIPRKNIRGKVFLVWWPPRQFHVPQ